MGWHVLKPGLLDHGLWTMDDGRWTMDDGRWTMDDGTTVTQHFLSRILVTQKTVVNRNRNVKNQKIY